MLYINTDFSTFFDVDETLVFWKTGVEEGDRQIQVVDPYTGRYLDLVPHERHIDLLLRKKSQGHIIIVWSAGGSEWARTIVNALGLQDSVDLVMAKPVQYVDDLAMDQWGVSRCYLGKHVKDHPVREKQ